MRCPWCGSPVMIRGSRWECGYCGDSGDCVPGMSEEEEKYAGELIFTFSPDEDFPEK